MSQRQDRSLTNELRLEDFEYDLPPHLIAQEPAPVRHESRLMLVDRQRQSITHHTFKDIPQLLTPGDVLVLNDTRVIPARLLARRSSGAQVEILLLRPQTDRPGLWQALASPLRKLKKGEELAVEVDGAVSGVISIADIVIAEDGSKRAIVDFGEQENVYKILSGRGYAPLPPYIQRARQDDCGAELRCLDLERYQTVFARAPGAVAAPTAGLHFSADVFAALKEKGVEICKLTLHVGPGTFKPISTSLAEHSIEAEEFCLPAETAETVNRALRQGRRVIAVGTTSCRALETAAVRNSNGERTELTAVERASTSLYIRPGYCFQIAGGLLTNFHLSRSSLLVLVSSFAGYRLSRAAYKTAVEESYRFFSYGDAMLIL